MIENAKYDGPVYMLLHIHIVELSIFFLQNIQYFTLSQEFILNVNIFNSLIRSLSDYIVYVSHISLIPDKINENAEEEKKDYTP